jgi:hypothetical protein
MVLEIDRHRAKLNVQDGDQLSFDVIGNATEALIRN